jgi:hypothetical protein
MNGCAGTHRPSVTSCLAVACEPWRPRLNLALCGLVLAGALPGGGRAAEATAPVGAPAAAVAVSGKTERFVAVDNICAWPHLVALPAGELLAFVFNQPCHGYWEGDIECWASTDGRFWDKRGTVAPHEPGTVRMNQASGLAANGDLIALVSGYDRKRPRPTPTPIFALDSAKEWLDAMAANPPRTLSPWVCRSTDGGRTWTTSDNAVAPPPGSVANVYPYGSIQPDAHGRLGAALYVAGDDGRPHGVWFYRSDDDGRSWHPLSRMGQDDGNETALLHLGGGHWLAVSRTYRERALEVLHSDDDGVAWRSAGLLTARNQHPAHLLRVADGRILLSYADRAKTPKEVLARFSEDEGETWGPPRVLATYTGDGGYPSSAQLADQTVVTAFYAAAVPAHQRYHMGVVRWRPTRQ